MPQPTKDLLAVYLDTEQALMMWYYKFMVRRPAQKLVFSSMLITLGVKYVD